MILVTITSPATDAGKTMLAAGLAEAFSSRDIKTVFLEYDLVVGDSIRVFGLQEKARAAHPTVTSLQEYKDPWKYCLKTDRGTFVVPKPENRLESITVKKTTEVLEAVTNTFEAAVADLGAGHRAAHWDVLVENCTHAVLLTDCDEKAVARIKDFLGACLITPPGGWILAVNRRESKSQYSPREIRRTVGEMQSVAGLIEIPHFINLEQVLPKTFPPDSAFANELVSLVLGEKNCHIQNPGGSKENIIKVIANKMGAGTKLFRLKSVRQKETTRKEAAGYDESMNDYFKIPDDMVALDSMPGIRCVTSVEQLNYDIPSAILLSAQRPDLIETVKSLKRKYFLMSVPIVVIGTCDVLACFAAGADECFNELDNGSVQKIMAVSNRMKQIWAMASRDDLTGLYKVDFINNFLGAQVQRYTETGVSFSVMMCDLDYFKQVNDNYGHNAGDKVLIEFANYLTGQLRKTDVVGRYGGEEFAVVFCNQQDAIPVAERIRRGWAEHRIILPGGTKIRSTFSAGLAVIGRDGRTREEILAAADDALIRAKRSGRDRVLNASTAQKFSMPRVSNAPVDFNNKVVIVYGDPRSEVCQFIKNHTKPLVVIDANSGTLASRLGIDPNTMWKHDWRVKASEPAKISKKTEVYSLPVEREPIELNEMDLRRLKEKVSASVKAGKKVVLNVDGHLSLSLNTILN